MKKDLDATLYEEYLNGNEDAFEYLYNKYKNKIQYFVFNIIGDYQKSEDIAQETFIYIMQHKMREEHNFKYYIYMIAKSRALNYISVNKRREEIDEKYYPEEIERTEKDVIDTIIRQENKKEMLEAINELDEKYKNAIYLVCIEKISYKETAEILDETVSNVKTLVHRGKKELKGILQKRGLGEVNKILKIIMIVLVTSTILGGLVYASFKLHEKNKDKQSNMIPIFTGKMGDTDTNNIWIGSFQLAWNEFLDEVVKGEVTFEDGESDLVNELNKKIFTKDMLNKDDYYIKVGKTTPELRENILNDLKYRFSVKSSSILDEINFDATEKSYTIYSMLLKNFEFVQPFDKLYATRFKDYEEKVEYFGINNFSDEKLNGNVEVLFYNDNNDFSVKLKTKENDEIILYRTNNTDSFDNLYKEVVDKSNKFNGNKNFTEDDELKVPYINVDTVINYDELCGRIIKGTDGMYISNALQNVKFTLNERGGNLTSEAGVKDEYKEENEEARYFYFTDSFIIFMKENDKNLPYFGLRINDIDILVNENN